MLGKTDWKSYIHNIRRREIDIIFSLLPQSRFENGLEIGAGDGFQTTLLAPKVSHLISSDLNFDRIKDDLKISGVDYQKIDADQIQGIYQDNSFDFIFSSNVLEHLRDPFKFLKDTRPMLKEDGYAVHIVPNKHMKFFYIFLFYPHMFTLLIDRLMGKLKGKPIFRGSQVNLENNINSKNTKETNRSRYKKFFLPTIHGNFPTHRKEFTAFGKKSWERMFKEAGYNVALYSRGPTFSGYGFGGNSIRKISEYFGISSEHIFVLKRMSQFQLNSWRFTNNFLPRGSFYEKEKFVGDWMRKERNAKTFVIDFQNAVGNVDGKRILDIGFGNGIMLLNFAKAGAIPVGLETDDNLLSDAKKRFSDNKITANLVIYDGKEFPLESNSIDYAYSTSVLEHMSYPQEVFNEVSRVLVPGGRFYLSFPNKYAPKESHTGLWFISYLPRFITQRILKWSGSSPLQDWNLHFVSFFSVKKMAKKADLGIIYDTKSSTKFKSLIKKALASIGIHYGVLLKTVILVLTKPKKE